MRRFLTRELDWKEGVAGTVIHEQYEQKNEIGEDGVPRDRMSKNTFVTRKTTAPRLRKIVLKAVTPTTEDDGMALRQALDDELESILNSVSSLVPSLQNQERMSLESYKKNGL